MDGGVEARSRTHLYGVGTVSALRLGSILTFVKVAVAFQLRLWLLPPVFIKFHKLGCVILLCFEVVP